MSSLTRAQLFGLGVVAACASIAASDVDARVTKITITKVTSPLFNGQSFGTVGTYEEIKGIAQGEIDPNDRHNTMITDLPLAPKNANGKVEYRTTFTIVKPVDMSKGQPVMLYNVPNRGNHSLPNAFLFGNDPGDGFIYKLGHTMVWSGWQGDQPISTVNTATQEGIDVPVAKLPNGQPLTSLTYQRFANGCRDCVAIPQPSGTPPARATTLQISGLGRTAGTLDTTKATLISATSETQSGVRGGVVTIPSTDWAWADCRTVPFPGTPDDNRVCLKNGFDPNLLYQLVYTAKDPFILGVGMAAMRDVISFLRYQAKDDAGTANPLAGQIRWVIGSGHSQSGRFQKNYVNLGFNEDENGKIIWDGMWPERAGQAGSFNVRFSQPGNIADLYEPGAEQPTWWVDWPDTARGRPAWGILHRCTQTNTCPLVAETYGGPEVWYSRGSTGISGTDAKQDIPLPPNVRRYYFAGTTHGGGGGGFKLEQPPRAGAVLASNPNPNTEFFRAIYVGLTEWVTKGREPPASAFPTIAAGTLVPANDTSLGYQKIPGLPSTNAVMNSMLDYDYGPQFNYLDGSGVITNVPPPVKQVIPTLAVKVDSDGNEIAGLRSVLQRMPLGTYTGWNPISSGIFKGQEQNLAGGYLPFAKTKAERIANGDPRPSIEERYPNLWGYFYDAMQVANTLVQQRYLLPEDAQRQINQLLNDMLATGLLPRRGEFLPGFDPKVHIDESGESARLEYSEE
jgi:hypothetical protein